MRAVIDEINNGQIIRNFGSLTFDVSIVEHTLRAGTICEGSFAVNARQGQLTEGYVYTTDYRMETLSDRFGGTLDEVAYRFHGEHMLEGTEVHGDFILVTNCGEYRIPFVIHAEGSVLDSSIGPIRNILHFTNLAKSEWDEALSLFYSPGFEKLFTGSDRAYLSAYKCLSGVKGSGHNMDELLVTMHKKTPVEYIPAQRSIEINDPEGLSRFSLDITRNGWGHTYFIVESEGDFITIEEDRVSRDSFLGNKYQLFYYIDSAKLHNGHNFGSIVIKADRHRTVIPVTVNLTGSMQYLRNMTRFRHEQIVGLMKSYSGHRLKKIPTRVWLNESNEIVEKMLDHDPEDLMAGLYRIHLMITQEHINEAAWNLKAIAGKAESVKDDLTYLWCYYLYLKSLTDEDALDINSLTEEVEYYYKRDPDSWRLCWLLAVMSEECQNAERRWEMFKESFERGCNSPAIYVEAARIVLDNPAFIRDFDDFSISVIRYICKQDALNDEVIYAIISTAQRMKECSPTVIRLLEYCYERCADDELLGIICLHLIKADRRDLIAHKWYGYGVERSVKITRLFEYYMMSIDITASEEILRPVLLYFSFQSDLDYETNAFLYAYIIRHKEDDPDMYSRYLRQMKEYVADQLAAKHCNRNLAIVYRDIIDSDMLGDDKLARDLADVIFMYEVDTSCHPRARRVILCYDHKDGEECYNIKDGFACVPIVSADHCLAIEDEYGNRISGTADVTEHQLISPGKLLLNLQLMVKDHTGIDAHYCMEHADDGDIRPENEFRFLSLLEKRYFCPEYAQGITMQLIRFYYDRDRDKELDKLLESLEGDQVSELDRNECIRYFVKRGLFAKAVSWLKEYGPDRLDVTIISELLHSWLPVFRDNPGEYEKLVCQLLFGMLKYDGMNLVGIQFLMKHLNSSVVNLKDVWVRAGELLADRHDLEERLLIQILFTGSFVKEKAAILRDYAYSKPDKEVLGACLNEACHVYFTDNESGFDEIVPVLTDAYETEDLKLNRICDLAYVKYFASHRGQIDDRVKGALKDALHGLLAEGVCIPGFKDLSDFMPSMTQYADIEVVEYKTTPGLRVHIHFMIDTEEEDYLTEPMNEVYGGVYTRVFVLFFGETLEYYITEENEDGEEQIRHTGKLVRLENSVQGVRGRFGLIDDMCMSRALKDYSSIDDRLEEYYRMDYITGRLFDICRD